MDEERHEKLMWNVTVLGAAENVFPVWGWSFLGPSVCKEGTGQVLFSVLAIHSEMVSGVKVEITNSKEVRGKGPVKWNIKSVGSNVWERLQNVFYSKCVVLTAILFHVFLYVISHFSMIQIS